MDPLSVAGSIAGIVAIADTVFTRTYHYARSVKNSEKDIANLATGIRSLSGLLHNLALFLGELQRDTTSETDFRLNHISACRDTLTKIEKRLETRDPATSRHSRAETLSKKIKWPFSVPETKELIIEVERHKSTINLALSADTLSTVFQALSRQSKMAEEFSELKSELTSKWAMEAHISLGKERKEVLNFFGKVDCTLNHQANLKLRHPLTGVWVTDGETFRSWLRIRNSKLWLSGVAGGGKTVLAASLIEETMIESKSNQAVAYFYCDYRDPEKQRPVNIIASIAAQLGRLSEEAFISLQEIYKTCHPEDRTPSSPELSHIIATVLEMANQFEDVSIIVDGLDECGTNTLVVLESLNKLVSNHQSNIRLIVLSREDLGIREVLEKDYTHLEIAAKSEDLKTYVAAELEARKGAGRGRLRIRTPELKEHIMKTLVDRAAGMFRWVSCQIDYLCELPTDAEKRKALTMLPPTLHGTYERILDGVNRSGQGIQRMVQATLQWVVSGKGGNISVHAICEAISIQLGDKRLDKEALYDEEMILSHCSSLLQVGDNPKLEGFELAHFTVKEFLTSIQPHSLFHQYSQSKRDVHPSLAKVCLTYVMLESFQSDVIEDFDEWNTQQIEYPFRIHAVLYWFKYAKHNWADEEILALTKELFDPSKTLCFLSWSRDYLFLHSYAYLDSDENQSEVFDAATRQVLFGGVGPLHIAASLGAYELCLWLLLSGVQINERSDLGTPLHCALMGTEVLSEFFVKPEWHSESQYMADKRIEVLQLLVERGADFNKSYKDPHGQEFSCTKLALHSSTKNGSNHPLTLLVGAGAKVDKDLLIAFEKLVEDENHDFSQDKEAYQKFIEALVEKLEQNTQDDVKSTLLDIALQFKTFSGLNQIGRNNTGLLRLPLEELQQKFFRAIRFDQTGMMELLLRDSKLDLSFSCGQYEETPLHCAVYYEAFNAYKMLLSLGASVEATDNEGNTPLHVAVMADGRDDECISTLLDCCSSLAAVNEYGCTPWHIAAECDNKAALIVFLSRDEKKEESLAKTEENGLIPLFCAAKHESMNALKLLLSQYSNLSQKCPLGMNILHYIVGMDSVDLLRVLQEKGGSLREKTSNGRTALHFIPYGVDLAVVRFLIEGGVSPTTTDDNGISPLHRLVQDNISNDMEVLRLLATDEAISLRNNDGHTPYYYLLRDAALKSTQAQKRYLELLTLKRVDLTTCHLSGSTSLQVLLKSYQGGNLPSNDHFFDILSYILDSATTDVESLNQRFPWKQHRVESYTTLVCLAIAFKAEKIVEQLLSKGADVNLVDEALNWSAVHYASFHGTNIDLYKKILAKSKMVNSCDRKGRYLPHIICDKGSGSSGITHHLAALESLGLNIDMASSSDGRTPFMMAAEFGDVSLAEWLLKHGANLGATNNFGLTAAHFACLGQGFPVLRAFKGLDFKWGRLGKVSWGGEAIGACTVLHLASLNSTQCLQIVLENNFLEDIDGLNSYGQSALHLAARFDKDLNTERLLASGANIEVQSFSGSRPIHVAAQHGSSAVIQILLRHGCDIGADSNGLTPELYALKKDRTEVASILKQQRIVQKKKSTKSPVMEHPRTKIMYGSSRSLSDALELAIVRGDLDLCTSLVNAGADFNRPIRSCNGCNPVLHALLFGRTEIARYLVEKGASALGQACKRSSLGNSLTLMGYSAVHLACHEKSQLELLSLLLAEDLKAGSPAFRAPVSPLHVAVACENHEAVKFLIKHEVGRSISLTKGSSAQFSSRTFSATLESHTNTTTREYMESSIINSRIDRSKLQWPWLLSKSTKRFITTDHIVGTALHIAVYVNSHTITKLLLEHGAKQDSVNSFLETPLHIAAITGSIELSNLLLQHGSNPFARQFNGQSTIELATLSNAASSFEVMSSLFVGGFGGLNCYGGNLLLAAHSSPKKFSYFFYQGLDPYCRPRANSSTPCELALSRLGANPAFLSLLCNLGLDFSRCTKIMSWEIFVRWSLRKLKVLVRCLPRSLVFREYDAGSWVGGEISPICAAGRRGRVDVLELLIQAGADLELNGDHYGTALISACSHGRLDSVKCLVRAGAKLFYVRGGKTYNALNSASHFEQIVHWLLVERFTDQSKIEFQSQIPTEQEVKVWAGVTTVKVIVDGCYEPLYGTSLLERMEELSKLRRQLRGQNVEILDSKSLFPVSQNTHAVHSPQSRRSRRKK